MSRASGKWKLGWGRAALQVFLCLAFACLQSAKAQTPVAATNIRELIALQTNPPSNPYSFSITGVATYVNPVERTFILQDDTGSMWCQGTSNFIAAIGDQIEYSGLYTTNQFERSRIPGFPDSPAGSDEIKRFLAPSNWGNQYFQRLRGFLHPPRTGTYHFWIASDDASALLLSINESPAYVRQIARVMNWTEPRGYTREDGQESDDIHLEAGKTYYIEARHQENWDKDHLSVAWEGPGIERSTIPGTYLSPWRKGPSPEHGAVGTISREWWLNVNDELGKETVFAIGKDLKSLQLKNTRLARIGSSKLPAPLTLDQRPFDACDNFRRAEFTGTASFVSSAGGTMRIDLQLGESSLQVRIPWTNSTCPGWLLNSRLHVSGACEARRNGQGQMVPSILWVSSIDEISAIKASNEYWNAMPITDLRQATGTNWSALQGNMIRIEGTVMRKLGVGELGIECKGIPARVQTSGV